jgi:hypothetical protein
LDENRDGATRAGKTRGAVYALTETFAKTILSKYERTTLEFAASCNFAATLERLSLETDNDSFLVETYYSAYQREIEQQRAFTLSRRRMRLITSSLWSATSREDAAAKWGAE